MKTFNYLIESSTLSFGGVQEAIHHLLLDGLDVRVTPVSRNRALIRSHILDAIRIQYGIDPWQYLRQTGVEIEKITAMTDDETLALMAHRAISELDDRPTAPSVASAEIATAFDWHLEKVNAPQAWSMLGGVDHIAWHCKVGQIDTGFLPHPALGFDAAGGNSSWFDTANSANFFIPNPASGSQQGGSQGQDPQVGPFWGHGTRIGSAISGFAPTATGGAFYGGAPRVPHCMVRISDTVIINDQQTALAQAIRHLVDVAQVDVINLSMGIALAGIKSDLKRALDHAYTNGVIMICAAGQHIPKVVAPARLSRTIAVGGINRSDQVWASASLGPEIDWSAPAADLRRATRKKPNSPFIYALDGDGTSYATALSTSAAALWLTHRSAEIAAAYGKTWQRVAAFKELGRSTARVPHVWGSGVAGTGILDIGAILTAHLPASASLAKEPAN